MRPRTICTGFEYIGPGRGRISFSLSAATSSVLAAAGAASSVADFLMGSPGQDDRGAEEAAGQQAVEQRGRLREEARGAPRPLAQGRRPARQGGEKEVGREGAGHGPGGP